MRGVGKRQRLVLLSYFLNVSQLLRSSIHSKGFRDAFLSLAFSLTGSPPLCGNYHLYCSLVKRGTVHMLFMAAVYWKTMKFYKLQLLESKTPHSLLLYASDQHFPDTASLTEWPSSSVLAEDSTVLCLCLWLLPTALMLGLAHTHAHTLSPSSCYRYVW